MSNNLFLYKNQSHRNQIFNQNKKPSQIHLCHHYTPSNSPSSIFCNNCSLINTTSSSSPSVPLFCIKYFKYEYSLEINSLDIYTSMSLDNNYLINTCLSICQDILSILNKMIYKLNFKSHTFFHLLFI